MGRRKFAHVPLILLGATLALGCGSGGSEQDAASSPSKANTSAGTDVPPAPDRSEALPNEEALPDEMAPTSSPEGQPANVRLTRPSTENEMPSVAMPALMPEATELAVDGVTVPSAGCGSTSTIESGRFTIDVAGTAREYILELPDGYDANRAHRLIFGWHWRGGTAQQVANGFYGLEERAEGSAIFVSPEGLDAGWANSDGRDLEFLDAMLERLQGEFCIDEARTFSTGWSYGGMMSLAVGCARGDVFRAIAPMSGALYSGCEEGDSPVAFFGYHGNDDNVVPYTNGVTARDEFVERNGCEPEAAAVLVDGCLQFDGCADGYPVTWCEFDGGHTPGPGSEQALWDFFSQF